MNETIWLALAMVLVLEGIGPMLIPGIWRRMITIITQLPNHLLNRFGGVLVIIGAVIFYILGRVDYNF
jgi:hypothetical protein